MSNTEELFYLQDSRSYVGNDVLFWAIGGNGYTTDVSKAQTYSKEDVQQMHVGRPSDIPWPKSYIDGKTRPAVDMQYIKRAEALDGTGIEIVKFVKESAERLRCGGCGAFISAANLWAGECPRCGTDNRP
jgi:hypothetical protein